MDSLGIGEMPDAAEFGDTGSHTLRSIATSPAFSVPHLCSLGFGLIDGVDCVEKNFAPLAAYGRMAEASKGKDTTVGHWELMGYISSAPLPTYPEGFPPCIIEAFERKIGRKTLCNRPFSGTEVLRLYGEEHIRTGSPIVYTSADSVFQIAAHEKVIPLDELYRMCQIARELLQGEHAVGRVIARPFITGKNGFERTANRHDFSIACQGKNLLDIFKEKGLDVIGLGKIGDIFAGRGLTESHRTHSNAHGMELLLKETERDFHGLCFLNLVEFDSRYGHRNDVDGYATALREFDEFLPELLARMREEDVLVITADHGCDPGTPSTDHSREFVPVLLYGKKISPVNLGTRSSFADLACSCAALFGVEDTGKGKSFLKELIK